jgi:hypothetical protein
MLSVLANGSHATKPKRFVVDADVMKSRCLEEMEAETI